MDGRDVPLMREKKEAEYYIGQAVLEHMIVEVKKSRRRLLMCLKKQKLILHL